MKNQNKKLVFNATVKEMKSDSSGFKVDVPFAGGVDIVQLKKGDKDPLFVTVEALSEQISVNKNLWTRRALESIAEQVNKKKPDAYLGHMKDEDRGYKTPESQTIWLGAKVEDLKGKSRLFIKGYVLPYAKSLKQYLKKSKAASKKVVVSVSGVAKKMWDSAKDAYNVEGFELESIDWSHPEMAGMKGPGYLSLTSEMKKKVRKMKYEDLTVEKLEEKRPDLVKEMVKASKETVSEMKKEVGKQEETVKEMKTELAGYRENEVNGYLDEKLTGEISHKPTRTIFRKLVVSEMNKVTKKEADKALDKVLNSDEGKALVTEMKRSTVVNPAKDNRKQKPSRKFLVVNKNLARR